MWVVSEYGDSEQVALTETDLSTGIFRGSIGFDLQVPLLDDGLFQVMPGDSIQGIYYDSLNVWGAPDTVESGTIYGGYSGDLSGVWTPSGNPYIVLDDATVPGGDTLRLEAGVVIEFAKDVTLNVDGLLVVAGAEGDSVRMDLTAQGWNWHAAGG